VAAAELVALLATGLFAGAAVYVTFVEHPARVEGGAALALAQFRSSYRRGAPLGETTGRGFMSTPSQPSRGMSL
jgi:hypothetical protein